MFSKFLVSACLCLCLFAPAWAQASSPAQAAPKAPNASEAAAANASEVVYLRALLEETRLLRLTMQQLTANTLRARILLEQIASQKVRVDGLTEDMAQIKAHIAQAQDPNRGAEELQEMETQIRECNDAQERERLLRAYQALKRTLERERVALQKEAAEQQSKQQQLEMTLRIEQAKLAEWQSQLDKLDQELERLTAENRPRR